MTATTGHIQPVDIHFDDLDAMGVVHNARYAVLLERVLTSYWLKRGWSADPSQSKFEDTFLAVREFTVTYHAPITSVGTAAIHFWIDRLGRTSVVYGFQVLAADRSTVHAEGTRVQVRIDPGTFLPAPISPELRSAAEPLLLERAA